MLLVSIPSMASDETDGWISITIGDEKSEFAREGIRFGAYLIATGEYGDWTMEKDFDGIQVFSRDDGSAWINQSLNQIREKIRTGKIAPAAKADTDGNGKCEMKGLAHGIYFIDVVSEPDEGLTISPMLLSIPDKEGKVQVRAIAKYEYKAKPTPTPTPTPTPKPTLTPFVPEEPTPTPTPTPTPEPTPTPTEGGETPTPAPPTPTPTATPTPTPTPTPTVTPAPPTPTPAPTPTPTPEPEITPVPEHVPELPVKKGEVKILLDDYETALGLGNIQMHVGVCFE